MKHWGVSTILSGAWSSWQAMCHEVLRTIKKLMEHPSKSKSSPTTAESRTAGHSKVVSCTSVAFNLKPPFVLDPCPLPVSTRREVYVVWCKIRGLVSGKQGINLSLLFSHEDLILSFTILCLGDTPFFDAFDHKVPIEKVAFISRFCCISIFRQHNSCLFAFSYPFIFMNWWKTVTYYSSSTSSEVNLCTFKYIAKPYSITKRPCPVSKRQYQKNCHNFKWKMLLQFLTIEGTYPLCSLVKLHKIWFFPSNRTNINGDELKFGLLFKKKRRLGLKWCQLP